MAEESNDVMDTGVEAAVLANEPLSFQQALQQVLQTSLYHDGLARGLKEAVKALDSRQAHLCILSSGCDEPAYSKLIAALCNEHDIPLVKVENGKELGQWAGLCKIDSEGQPRKVVRCSCVVIKSWGAETPARQIVLEELKKK